MFHNMRVFRWMLAGVLTLALAGLSVAQEGGVPGVTEDTIKLGSFIAQSGALASIGIPVVHGAQTWYSFVNDVLGGVHGRRIEFIALDDAFDPAKTVSAVKKLVEEEQVFAIVNPLGTITNAAVFDYLVEKGVPVVSPHANATFLCLPTTPNYFSIQPNNVAFGRTLAQYAIMRLGSEKIGVLYVDDAFGNELKENFVDEARKRGVEPVAVISYPLGETSFSSYVLNMRQAEADTVALLGYLADGAAILKEAETLGYKPQWLGTNTLTDLTLFALAGVSAAEGLIATGFALDPSTQDSVAAYLFRELLNKYFPGEIPSGFSEIAYVGAQQVVEALRRAGPDLSREAFIAALETFTNWDSGLTPPITYTAEDHCGIEDLWLIQAQNGAFVFLEEWKLEK